jgi:hypothetical protein
MSGPEAGSFRFVGPTICNVFMQATGIVNGPLERFRFDWNAGPLKVIGWSHFRTANRHPLRLEML